MEARLTEPPKEDREANIAAMKNVLNELMTNRTTRSTYMDSEQVLVELPPHETRRIRCALIDEQRAIIRTADETIMIISK